MTVTDINGDAWLIHDRDVVCVGNITTRNMVNIVAPLLHTGSSSYTTDENGRTVPHHRVAGGIRLSV